MEIILNSKKITVDDGMTLSRVLEQQGIAPTGIATAVNGAVVSRDKRDSYTLTQGDNIVIIKAFYGG